MLRRKRLGVFGVIALAVPVLGCQELPLISEGDCGNEIIDVGEDCDGKAPDDIDVPEGVKVVCGDPSGPRACRFDCAPVDSGKLTQGGCPTTYTCGADGICRAPKGEFGDATPIPASPSHVLLGDFDGDGLSDLLSLDDDTGRIDVYFFERDGAVARTFSIPSDGALPAIGELVARPEDAEQVETRDFTIAVQGGMGVMRGQPDRSFVATAYSSIVLPWNDVRLIPLILARDPLSKVAQHGMIGLHQDGNGVWGGYVFDPTDIGVPGPKFTLPSSTSVKKWAPRLPVGNFAEDLVNSASDEIVFVPVDGDRVQAVSPLGPTGWNANPEQHAPVHLPPGKTVKSALAAHLNPVHGSQPIAGRDNHLDLVIEGSDGVYVAFGLGNGTFASGPTPPAIPDLALKIALPTMPLAIVDINSDGAPDAVLRNGIFLSATGALPAALDQAFLQGYYPAAASLQPFEWEEAVVVDFNGDGLLDVVASSVGETGIQIFTNVGNGTFNPNLIATERHASQFVVGDFDGDLQPDLAFRQGGPTGAAEILVIYGRKGEAPLAPVPLGALENVTQMAGAVDVGPPGQKTSISNLAVMTTQETGAKIAAFLGRADRLLQSPFLFFDSATGTYGRRIEASTIGKFHSSAEDHGDIAVVVSDQAPCVPSAIDPTLPKDPKDTRRDGHLWLLRGTGAAQIDSPAAGGSLCKTSDTVVWESAVLAPLDIDGDGQDELIIVAPNKGKGAAGSGALFIAHAMSTGGFDLGELIPLPEPLYDRSLDAGGKALRRNSPVCVADVDGDGNADVVLLSVDNSLTVPKSGVSILWGSGSATAPFSGSDVGHVSLAGAEADNVNGFACTDADGDAAADIVFVTAARTYIAHGGKSRALEATELLDDSGKPLVGGISVASDNIDDDGLRDLAISGPGGILVYRGKAKNP